MNPSDLCSAVEQGRTVAVPANFRSAVRGAIQEARNSREIGLIQYWRLMNAVNSPRQLSKIYAGVVDEAIACGEMSEATDLDGFDWDSLLAFIERLLPLILQLIAIF
jgi:hypothetical protein